MTIPEFWSHGWTAALVNHLWQSTAIALLAWLLTLALRNNAAHVRYAIWLFASIKFLIPFSLLAGLGAHWAKPALSNSAQIFYLTIEEFSRPLRQAQVSVSPATPVAPNSHAVPVTIGIISAMWLLGCIVVSARWISGLIRAIQTVRSAERVDHGREFNALHRTKRKAGLSRRLPLLLAACETEPGIFGMIRPVLLWPSGLSEHLDEAQIEAIMAHEVEHVRRHDNLTAAIHAFVEALFWFHPLVRWMTRKMNEERERACDEKVIEQNALPDAYAESILKVCAFCMEPPTPCVAGVSGADLKDRILRIMTRRSGVALSSATKLALCTTAFMILAAPLGFGMLHGQATPTPSSAQSESSAPNVPKYEVATIKPTTENENRRMIRILPDGISLQGANVQMLLQQAFGVERDRIVDAPKWVQSNLYDVEAKVAPEDAPKMDKLKMEQRNEMLLPLLQERLNLKYHHETRDLPMYALTVAKGGPKLTEAKPGEGFLRPDGRTAAPGSPVPPPGGPALFGKSDGPPAGGNRPVIGEGMRMRPGSIESRGGSTDFLAHALSAMLGRTVMNKTDLTGRYDFSLNWTPDESMRTVLGGPEGGPKGDAQPDAGGPSLFTALQEQLGLKLESRKEKVDVVVIDHIDLPTAN